VNASDDAEEQRVVAMNQHGSLAGKVRRLAGAYRFITIP
jgi:hypothetical protein